MQKMLVLLFLASMGSIQSQQLPDKFVDKEWAYYNQNIQIYLNDVLGNALMTGISEDYVMEKLAVEDFIFHQYNTLYIDGIRRVDYSEDVNQPFYWFDFDRDKHISLASILLYIGENYSGFYGDHLYHRPYLKHEYVKLRDSLNLENNTNIVFREKWYLEHDSARFFKQVTMAGLCIDSSSEPIVWVDLNFVEQKVLNRFNMINMAGISSFTEYLNKQPFYAKSLDMYFSRTEVQRGADPFNSELEAYVYAEQMKDEAKRAFYHLPENQKSAGEVKNDKLLGAMPYGIFEGSWTCFDNEGNMLANYHFSNGVLDGDYILYYKNGRVAELGSFKAGLKHGPSTKLYRNKKPLARLNYQNGIFDGPQRFFYANKKPYLTFSFADGKKNGLCTIAYDDGTVKMSGLFKDDYIFDVWEYNIKLEESFCSFLKDQEDYNIRSPNIALGAMKDCTASFEYTFRHELTKDCYNGLCVLPSLGGEVK